MRRCVYFNFYDRTAQVATLVSDLCAPDVSYFEKAEIKRQQMVVLDGCYSLPLKSVKDKLKMLKL